MNGRYFLDTNAIIQLLKGNPNLIEILHGAKFITCSVISKLEYLSFSNLSENDIKLFDIFAKKVEIMDLPSNNNELHQYILNIRHKKKLKLPDAIIVGCSMYTECTLLTADKQILKLKELDISSYDIVSFIKSE